MKISLTKAAQNFKCLQADCPDTCCKGWSMQLDDATFEKYKGSGLENAVDHDGDIRVMKRDKATDFCVKFENGICAIHRDKGESYLGDACNFYPRVTRKLGEATLVTLTPSCPEAARLMLENGSAELTNTDAERLPSIMKDWLPSGVNEADAPAIHGRFLEECRADASSAHILARIYSVSSSLQYLDRKDWAGATNLMFRMADAKLLPPEPAALDEMHLFQVFLGILHATGKARGERLMRVLDSIAEYLGIEVDYTTLVVKPVKQPQQHKAHDEILKNYLALQLSFTTYPFAGLGEGLFEKAKILIFKFCLTRLALEACGDMDVVDTIQPLARIVDHLGDARLMLNLMDSFGWNTEPRLLGLIARS